MTALSSCYRTLWLEVIRQSGAILLLAVIISLSINQFRPGKLTLVRDWSPEAQLKLESGDNLIITFEEAETLFLTQSALFLDARSREDFAEGHIQGAFNLPPDEFEKSFPAMMADIPKEARIVAYCDGESCGLSRELALALFDSGYPNVRVLVNGWSLWEQKYLPVETGGERSLN